MRVKKLAAVSKSNFIIIETPSLNNFNIGSTLLGERKVFFLQQMVVVTKRVRESISKMRGQTKKFFHFLGSTSKQK